MSDAEQTGRSKTSGGTTQVIKMLTAGPDFSTTSQNCWERTLMASDTLPFD